MSRTNTAPWDKKLRVVVSLADLDTNIETTQDALAEYQKQFTYTDLGRLNAERSICLSCGFIVPANEGRAWLMVDTRDNPLDDREVTFCLNCHGNMIAEIVTEQAIEIHEGYEIMQDAQDDHYE